MRSAALLLLVTLLSACVNLRIETAHEPDFDFSAWKSFAIASSTPPAVAPGVTPSPAGGNAAIERELARVLGEKGYTPADAAQADFIVHFQGGTWSKPRFTQEHGVEGRLQVRLVDRGQGEVAWEGHAHETWLSNMDSAEEIRKAVEQLFDGFPPGS